MHWTNLSIILLASIAAPALADPGHGGGRGGGRGGNRNGSGGGFNRGNQGGGGGRGGQAGAPPNTLVTVTAPPPAATSARNGGNGGNGNNANNGNNGTNNGNNNNNGGNAGNGAVRAALIPPFGVTPGIKANDGTANCVGLGGKGIPCDCPPSVNTMVQAVETQIGVGLAFPTGNSVQDQLTRLGTCIVALQNFKGGIGSGVGCPAVATNWNQLRSDLQAQL